jgi:hypothetical protein
MGKQKPKITGKRQKKNNIFPYLSIPYLTVTRYGEAIG